MQAVLPRNEEIIQSPSTRSHLDRRLTYNGVRPSSPRGSFTTLLSLSKQHVTFHLGLLTAPVADVCRSNPLQCIPSTPVTASHVTLGTDVHVTLRYGPGVGFMGGGAPRIKLRSLTDITALSLSMETESQLIMLLSRTKHIKKVSRPPKLKYRSWNGSG